MDQETNLLIASVIINILLIIERMFNKIKKSKCCNSEIELQTTSQQNENKIVDLRDININK
jgi:hypothetical protein